MPYADIVTHIFSINEKLASVTMNTMRTAINNHDHLATGAPLGANAMLTDNDQTITGIKTFTTAPVLPATYANANKMFVWFVSDTLSTGTYKSAILTSPWAGTIQKAFAFVGTAPTGASIIVDINKGTTTTNGTTIWSTQANRLTITAGTTSATQTAFNTTAVSANDILSIDIDAIGSSVAGSNLTVMLQIAF